MDHRHLLRIAGRIDAALLLALGQGIDLAQMIDEPLYARDVLLVCDALADADLAALAQEFRAAAREPDEVPAPAAAETPDSGGWRASKFLGSLFGQPLPNPDHVRPAVSKARQRGFGRFLSRTR